MLKFSEWLVLESGKPVTWDAVWAYYNNISKSPNLDDLKTLGNIFVKAASTEPDQSRSYNMFTDLWGGIKHSIIPVLPKEEQQVAMQYFANLKTNLPNYNRLMVTSGVRKFTSIGEFEDFIVDGMKKDSGLESIMKVIQKPENAHFWAGLDEPFKQELLQWLKQKQAERNSQPSFGDMIRRAIRRAKEEPDVQEYNLSTAGKCPKCGSENTYHIRSLKGNANCIDCGAIWTDFNYGK